MGTIQKISMGVGAAVFLFGAVALVLSFVLPAHTTLTWYGQVFGFMAAGTAWMVGTYNKDKIMSAFKSNAKQEPNKDDDVKPVKPIIVDDSAEIELEAERYADFRCLNHLAERMSQAKDSEGMELCRNLQNKLFELHHGKITSDTATTR